MADVPSRRGVAENFLMEKECLEVRSFETGGTRYATDRHQKAILKWLEDQLSRYGSVLWRLAMG